MQKYEVEHSDQQTLGSKGVCHFIEAVKNAPGKRQHLSVN